MMEIPQYKRTQTIPGTTGGQPVDPSRAAQPFEAAAKMEQTAANVGYEGLEIVRGFEAAMEVARAHSEEYNVRTEMAKDKLALNDQLTRTIDPVTGEVRLRTDYQNIETEAAKVQEKNLEKYKRMVTNPYAWEKLQPAIAEHQITGTVAARNIARKLEIDKMKVDWMNNMDTAEEMYVRTGDRGFIDNAIRDTKGLIMAQVVGAEEGMRRADSIGAKADMTRFSNINRSDPDVAERLLSDREKNFPFLDAEAEYKAGMKIEQRRKAIEAENAKALKQVHNNNAKDAFDRSLLWKKGKKASDGLPFEEYLDRARSTDQISESTYQMYVNKIERAKDRALTASLNPKWTVADHIKFGQIEAQFLDPNNDLDWDDIAKMTKGLPVSASGRLADILARQPSKERKSLMSTQWQFISKKLKESEASPETWEETRTTWENRLKDTKDADISKLAKELVQDLPPDSMTQLLNDMNNKKMGNKAPAQNKAQPASQKPVEKKKLKFNPVTGDIE